MVVAVPQEQEDPTGADQGECEENSLVEESPSRKPQAYTFQPIESSPSCASKPLNIDNIDWRSGGTASSHCKELSFDQPPLPQRNSPSPPSDVEAPSSRSLCSSEVAAIVQSWEEKMRLLMQDKWAVEVELRRERAMRERMRVEAEEKCEEMKHTELEVADLHKVLERLLELPLKKQVDSLKESNSLLKHERDAALIRAAEAEHKAKALQKKMRRLEEDLRGVSLIQAQLMESPDSSPQRHTFKTKTKSVGGMSRGKHGRECSDRPKTEASTDNNEMESPPHDKDMGSPESPPCKTSTWGSEMTGVISLDRRGEPETSPSGSVLSGRGTVSPGEVCDDGGKDSELSRMQEMPKMDVLYAM